MLNANATKIAQPAQEYARPVGTNLLLNFETISQIACASVEKLQKVPKIGKKKAELIHRIFH